MLSSYNVIEPVRLIPYRDLLGDMPPMAAGRPIRQDGIVGFGKNKGALLSELNSHALSWVFRALVRDEVSRSLLRVVWAWGIARLSPERIQKGDGSDALVDLWCTIARRGRDLPPDVFDSALRGEEFWEHLDAQCEALQEVDW